MSNHKVTTSSNAEVEQWVKETVPLEINRIINEYARVIQVNFRYNMYMPIHQGPMLEFPVYRHFRDLSDDRREWLLWNVGDYAAWCW